MEDLQCVTEINTHVICYCGVWLNMDSVIGCNLCQKLTATICVHNVSKMYAQFKSACVYEVGKYQAVVNNVGKVM